MKKLLFVALFILSSCKSNRRMIVINDKDSSKETVKAKLILPTIDPNKKIETIEDPDSIEVKKELNIKEKFFLTQINDIYVNYDDYKNTLVTVEGMYSVFTSIDGSKESPVVYRNGPGCCGNDGWGGFLLKNYDGEYPNENDWIKVSGIAEIIEDSKGYRDLYLNVRSLEILNERGKEYVED